MIETNKVFRIQASEKETCPFLNRTTPVKRIIVADNGALKFNPDSNKFVYFSRNEKHHTYYIFNKVLKIIKEEVAKASKDPQYAKLKLSNDFRAFSYQTNVNIEVIKRVREFFANYIPPKYLELVTLKYLNSFSSLMDECTSRNVSKDKDSKCPEISDTGIFGGAYGINSTWLDLLNCCTISSSTAQLPITKVFDFLLDTSYKAHVSKQRLSFIFNTNPYLMDLLKEMTYKHLANPQFFNQNNTNDVVRHLETIKEQKLYNSAKAEQNRPFSPSTHKKFKTEIQAVQEFPELYIEK